MAVPKVGKLPGPFSRLRSCKSFPEAKSRLLAGVGPTGVARFMHSEGDYTECSYQSLAAMLCAYRKTLSSTEMLSLQKPGFVSAAVKEIEDGLDELSELAEIFQVQKARILQGRKLETKLGVLNKTLGNEVRIAGELLRTSVTVKQQLAPTENGDVRATHPGPAFQYDTRSRYGDRVAQVIEDPGKRNRVLNAVSALIAAGSSSDEDEKVAAKVAG